MFRIAFGALSIAVFLILFSIPSVAEETPAWLDLDGLCAAGDDWQVVTCDQSAGAETVYLYQDRWAMYFLHWRPLDETNRDITADYMNKLMVNFWGENMPFDLDGEGGEITVTGHKGRYLDGSSSPTATSTRE